MSRRWMPDWYQRIRQGRAIRRITAGCEVVGVDEEAGFVVVRIPDRLWSEIGPPAVVMGAGGAPSDTVIIRSAGPPWSEVGPP